MGFVQDPLKFVACIKFLETIKPKRTDIDTIKVIHLVSPSESPKKTADKNILKEYTNTTKEHEKVHEEDDTQSAPLTTTTYATGNIKDKEQNWKENVNRDYKTAVPKGL